MARPAIHSGITKVFVIYRCVRREDVYIKMSYVRPSDNSTRV